MPITVVPSDNASSDSGQPTEVPAWLAVRRERQATDAASAPNSPPEPVVAVSKPPVNSPLKSGKAVSAFAVVLESRKRDTISSNVLTRWISRQSLLTILASLAIHSVVLIALAFIVISRTKPLDEVSLWGVVGDDDFGGTDMILDTGTPMDSGESAPLQLADVTQSLDLTGPGTNVAESTRLGSGGRGNGEGETGDGTSMGVGSLRIPGHAQTKGSFSAWADPRDPMPGKDYFIVIQFQLPKNVKKYRATDLTGDVKGTDNYKQPIRFKSGDQFPVENGSVQIRIRVPGASRLVRDTIHVESKLLREKQTFEIEF